MTTSARVGISLIVLALATFGFVALRNSPGAEVLVFSDRVMLESLWRQYKADYIEAGTGRAIDRQRNGVTTSEGQSYTMLRAVWMDDRETFDLAWKWTQDNLGRDEDALSSWLFGERADGTYGVLDAQGGYNSATDADQDIALALILAYERWGDRAYLDQAREIVGSIWEKDVLVVGNSTFVLANDLEARSSTRPIVNPSYLSPYAYRVFAAIDEDPAHDWMGAVDTSYWLLERATDSGFGATSTGALPPDWVVIDRQTGEPDATGIEGLSTDYGFDAMRTPWRVAMDHYWSGDPRARAYLEKLSALGREWREKGMIARVYAHDGAVVDPLETAAAYGGAMGYFAVVEPELARQVYEQKLRFLYNQDTGEWRDELGYYDSNWAWFGLALYADLLPNLGAPIEE
jgi:endo-1,4-beta-D-glucanase Y